MIYFRLLSFLTLFIMLGQAHVSQAANTDLECKVVKNYLSCICSNGASNPYDEPACTQCPSGQTLINGKCAAPPVNCTNGADNPPTCNQFPPCTNGATNAPVCTIFPPCSNGANNPPACTQCPSGQALINGQCATPPVNCTNGADNPPTCNQFPALTCSNGAIDYPTCTPPKCSNGADNPPACTQCPSGQALINGKCAAPPVNCTNGAGNPPTCNQFPALTCGNGATDYPNCNQCPQDQILVGGKCQVREDSINCFFNWAEDNFPYYFSSPIRNGYSTYYPYSFRYYVHTNYYLGVSAIDEHVYYLPPGANRKPVDAGLFSYWKDQAGCGSTYKIGSKGPAGGIVFDVDVTGQHGLEAQHKDATAGGQTSTQMGWTTAGQEYKYLDGSLQSYFTWNEALKVVQRYGAGWYLPTKDQLNLLYQRQDVVGGFDGVDHYYWSSTEYDAPNAWYQHFGNSYQHFGNKNVVSLVRAVRAF